MKRRTLDNLGFALMGAGFATVIAVVGVVLIDNGMSARVVRALVVLAVLVVVLVWCCWDLDRAAKKDQRSRVDLMAPEPTETRGGRR